MSYTKKKKGLRALATRKSPIPKTFFLFFHHTRQHPIYISKHSISYKPPKTNKKVTKHVTPTTPFSLNNPFLPKKAKKKKYLPCFSHSPAHTHILLLLKTCKKSPSLFIISKNISSLSSTSWKTRSQPVNFSI